MFRRVILSFKNISYRYQSTTTIGFIGLGVMGLSLAQKLVKAGTDLIAYDLDKTKSSQLSGATIASSGGEVAAKCDILFVLLPDYNSILQAITGPEGILKYVKEELLFVNLSAIGPVNSIRLQSGFAERKCIQFLSAPLIGSNNLGPDSNFRFIVSGNQELLGKVDKYLRIMCQHEKYMKYVGPNISDAQSILICNTLLLAATMVAVAEVMNLGDKLGLDLTMLAEVLNSADAHSYTGQFYNPMPGISKNAPANRKYKEGHNLRILYRTLIVAQDVANRLKAPTPVLSSAMQMYSLALSRGFGDLDYSTVIKLYEMTLLHEDI